MEDHAEAIEADLLRYYRVDLLDWFRGELSSRRLSVLVSHLPTDSALARELHGDGAEWSVAEYLLAAAVDHLALGNWMFSAVHRDEDAGMPEAPVPVPRPGDAGEFVDRGSGQREIARFFGGTPQSTPQFSEKG